MQTIIGDQIIHNEIDGIEKAALNAVNPPEWFYYETYPLELKPWVIRSAYRTDYNCVLIGNSGLGILQTGEEPMEITESRWKQEFTPNGYEGKLYLGDDEDNANFYKNSVIYSAAITSFMDFWRNDWPADLIKPDILKNVTNKKMFNFRNRLLNETAPGSFSRLQKNDLYYQLDLQRLSDGIEEARANNQQTSLLRLSQKANTNPSFEMHNVFVPMVKDLLVDFRSRWTRQT